MQATFQKHLDNACSKTINLPQDASVEDVQTAYYEAFDSNCKGVTVYRDKCRENQPMSLGEAAKAKLPDAKPKKRRLPRVGDLIGYKFTERLGDIYVNLRVDKKTNEITELFASPDQSNSLLDIYINALSIAISLGIRYGVPAEVYEKLERVKNPDLSPAVLGPFGVTTGPEAFGKALRFFRLGLLDDKAVTEYYRETSAMLDQKRKFFEQLPDTYKAASGTVCPDCGGTLFPNPGCVSGNICYSCGYTSGPCKG
jgi:ribonucleoside-diphosphate reductase alpha chain